MRLDGPLGVGAAGGHGPVRYFVTAYEPSRRIEFQFTGPSGFHGHHSFTATSLTHHSTLLRHELSLSPSGSAKLTWPLIFRPMHDALIEESLDCAEPVSYTHLRAHETVLDLVCRLLLEKKKIKQQIFLLLSHTLIPNNHAKFNIVHLSI